jgi:hypothetical protein
MHVEILTETERWYQVRSEDGIEAWINKPLVITERGPVKSPRPTSATLAQQRIPELPSLSSTTPEVIPAPRPESMAEPPRMGATLATPLEEWHVIPERSGVDWVIGAILRRVPDMGLYVMGALGLVLVLSIALQLRASRQLRRATQEMGQIVDLMHEIYVDDGMARTSNKVSAINPVPMESAVPPPVAPALEFSPIEQGVLEALSEQPEVQEGELVKVLTEKGFASILIKEIISDIVRKTEASGRSLVEVRYVHGRYSYRLRPLGMSQLRMP